MTAGGGDEGNLFFADALLGADGTAAPPAAPVLVDRFGDPTADSVATPVTTWGAVGAGGQPTDIAVVAAAVGSAAQMEARIPPGAPAGRPATFGGAARPGSAPPATPRAAPRARKVAASPAAAPRAGQRAQPPATGRISATPPATQRHANPLPAPAVGPAGPPGWQYGYPVPGQPPVGGPPPGTMAVPMSATPPASAPYGSGQRPAIPSAPGVRAQDDRWASRNATAFVAAAKAQSRQARAPKATKKSGLIGCLFVLLFVLLASGVAQKVIGAITDLLNRH